ncbi:MAG: glycine zipper 2TM domain-containing protein [Candidatus Omnitrophota bacterium]
MKRLSLLLVVLTFILAVSGCQSNKTRVAEGAGVGGVVGALAGGIIGHQTGSGVEGALIGGALGAGTGALVGSQINKPEQNTASTAVSAQNQVTVQKIVEMTKQGINSDEIISKVKSSNSKYSLTADDLDYLKKQGVSQRVIETMQGL